MALQRETPIEVFQSDDKLVTVRFRRRDPDGTLSSLNLSGNTQITFTCKANRTDTAALFTYTKTGGQITVLSAGSGAADKYSEITIQFTGTDIATVAKRHYSIKWTNASSKVETIAYGPLIISDV